MSTVRDLEVKEILLGIMELLDCIPIEEDSKPSHFDDFWEELLVRIKNL